MACCSAASTVVRGRPSLLQRWQLLAHNELMIGQGSFLTQREGHIVVVMVIQLRIATSTGFKLLRALM